MNENETHTELPAHGDEIEGYIELPAPSAIAFATSIDADGPEYRSITLESHASPSLYKTASNIMCAPQFSNGLEKSTGADTMQSVTLPDSLLCADPFVAAAGAMAKEAPAIGMAMHYHAMRSEFHLQSCPKPILHPSGSSVLPPKKMILPVQWCRKTEANLERVPTYYPMEQTTISLSMERFVTGPILLNIVNCLKIMSIQAKFVEDPVSAALLTEENVEIYLSFWKNDDSNKVIIEIQRRRGCSMTFHKYCRRIFDAAENKFDDGEFQNVYAGDDVDLASLKKSEMLLHSEVTKNPSELREKSVMAIEIAHELIKKERVDARLLGLESLCLLTDARRTGLSTAVMTSVAVLLGVGPHQSDSLLSNANIFREVRDFILNVIQFRNLGDNELGKESNDIDPDSDDEDFFDQDEDVEGYPSHLKETLSVMIHLALTTVTNALEVMTNIDVLNAHPELCNRPDFVEISSAETIDAFLRYSEDFSSTNIVATLLDGVRKAEKKPHNAFLSTKGLRLICKPVLGVPLCLIRKESSAISHALSIGRDSHLKLERECSLLLGIL